ncbi:MAG TPA: four helix bundle protein [Fodinibius sp.]|nr:four helix bundle protein [Fodinibius sp.]
MGSSKKVKSFEDLKVWQSARKLRNNIFVLTKDLPDEERYRLKDQLIRASRSVTANIAEGYGRFHYQEYIQYCRQARGSVYEVLDHLICAKGQNFISSEEVEEFR